MQWPCGPCWQSLRERGVAASVYVVGGAAMALAYGSWWKVLHSVGTTSGGTPESEKPWVTTPISTL